MAGSPLWKLYRGREYVGCMKDAEDAAAMVAILGAGATVRWYHSLIVWTEGEETQSAAESYDAAAEVMSERVRKHQEACYDRGYGKGAAAKVLASTGG